MRDFWIIMALAGSAAPVFAESPYVFLFQSAHARAVAGAARQKARRLLAQNTYERAARLLSMDSVSRQEYDTYLAAERVSFYDLQLAEIRVKEEALSLNLAMGLARQGQRIALCRRKKPIDEDTVSPLLKKVGRYNQPVRPPEDLQGNGTQILVQRAEDTAPPSPPDVNPPQAGAPDVSGPATGPGSSGPTIDVDVAPPPAPRPVTPPPVKPPAPKPGPKPKK